MMFKNIPKAVHPFTPPGKLLSTDGMHHDSIDTGSTSKEAAAYETGLKSSPYFSPNNLFSSPLGKCSPFGIESIEAFADEVSDSVLLFNVPSNMSFPQAEILQSPLKCKTQKDIVATDSKFENEKTGAPTANNAWISEESLEWDSLFWNDSFVGSSETMPGGSVLFPEKTHQ